LYHWVHEQIEVIDAIIIHLQSVLYYWKFKKMEYCTNICE